MPTPDSPPPPVEVNHEVWIIDQSNTYDSGSGMLDCGGRIHIYTVPTASFPNATPQVIELGGEFAELVRTQTGTVPVRPHFITFNASQTHAIVSFVGDVMMFEGDPTGFADAVADRLPGIRAGNLETPVAPGLPNIGNRNQNIYEAKLTVGP